MSHTNTKPRILIVDDNQDIHQDFRKILQRNEDVDDELAMLDALFEDDTPQKNEFIPEIQIDSAYQGQEGFEKVRTALNEGLPYSLAFIDVRMPPGWDGIETTKRIWEIDPDIQVVVCSAYSDYSWQEIIHQLQHPSRFLILKKPFESIEVRQLVSTLHQRWHDARHDHLTGLVNRRAFMDHFHRQQQTCTQDNIPLSCIMIDLDFFKRVNDDHGHGTGDEVLRNVASILNHNSRPGDIICRYGGEELCVLLRNADEQTATEWAERARHAIASTRVADANKKPVFLTASFGVCELDPATMTPDSAMEYADSALRTAKDIGRNRVVTHRMMAEGKLNCGQARLRHLFEGMTARDIMLPIASIPKSKPLKKAALQLIEDTPTSMPVINANGELAGQLTERDILQSLMVECPEELSVEQVMNTSVVQYDETTPLQEIFEFLVRVSIPQVVVAREGSPIGVIARRALLEYLLAKGFSTNTAPIIPTLPVGPINQSETTA